jgi:hypothetical protein
MAQVKSLPIGASVSKNGDTYTKVSAEEWNDGRGGRYSNDDMAFELNYGRTDWIVATDNAPIQLAGFDTPEPVPLTGGEAEILQKFEAASIGDIVSSGIRTFTKISADRWKYDSSGAVMEISSGRLAEVAAQTNGSISEWTITNNDLPEPTGPFSGTLPESRTERQEVLSNLPVGSTVTVNSFTFEKTANNRWYTEQDPNQPYTDLDVSWAGSRMRPGEVVPFVESTHDVTVPHDLAPEKHARRRSITSAPVGSTITGANGRTYAKREGSWDDLTFGINGYSDDDIVAVTSPVNGNAFKINPDPDAATTTGIHPGLPAGTFLPNSEGSSSGLRKVENDRWELMLDGRPTGRFSNDDYAQMMMDMNGTTPVAPVIDTTNVADFGRTDYGVADLGLGGKSLGDWMLDTRGNFGSLTPAQKQAIRDGYARFIDDLNTRLPAGITARQSGEGYFSSNNFQHTTSFYKNGTHIGDATRDYNTAYQDDRTGERVSHVHHSLYQITDQGGGISSAFLKASKEFYRQLGIDRITVQAALSVGGYAWARGGFDFEGRNAMAHAVTSWNSRKPTGPVRGQTQAEFDALMAEWDALVARATPENYLLGLHPLPRDFANVGRPSGRTTKEMKWFGKNILKGSGWHGEFLLNPERVPNPFAQTNAGPVTEVAEAAPVGV